MKIPAIPADKAMHYVYGSAVSVIAFVAALQFLPLPVAGAVAVSAALLVGVMKEVWDMRRSGTADALDAVWTGAGGLPVALVGWVT